MTQIREDTVIFRLSQKLNAKIKAGKVGTLQPHENLLADWSAQLFLVARIQYVLVSNTSSLYSVVTSGRGITDRSEFINRVLAVIREFMQADGFGAAYEQFITPMTSTVRFAKALDRSVTGSMNELIRHASFWLADGERSAHEVSVRLNDVLMSALAREGSFPYGKPREAFKTLVEAEGRTLG